MSLILAITGASGAVYAVRLLHVLLAAGQEVHLSISTSGRTVLLQELGIDVDLDNFRAERLLERSTSPQHSEVADAVWGSEVKLEANAAGRLHYYHYADFMAPIASGSFRAGGMVICPCSGTTLSAIAHANASNLIQRAAEVQLKERRKLILVPRETPLSSVQLENMHRASQAGAVVLPAAPGWYHGVHSLKDLVDFVVSRICDQLGVRNELVDRWGGDAEAKRV